MVACWGESPGGEMAGQRVVWEERVHVAAPPRSFNAMGAERGVPRVQGEFGWWHLPWNILGHADVFTMVTQWRGRLALQR